MSDLYFGTLNRDIPHWARKYYASGNDVDMEFTATPESCQTQYADPNDAWSTKKCEVVADANPALKLRSAFCKVLTDEGNGGRVPYCSIWQDQKGHVTFPEYGPDYLHCIKPDDGYIDTTIPECALACQENPKQLGCTTSTLPPPIDKVKVRQQCIDLNFWQPEDPGCENVARSEPELKLRHNICTHMIQSDFDNFDPNFDPPTEAYHWCEVNDTNGVVFPEYQHCIKPDGFIDDTQADCAQVCTGNPNHPLCAKMPPPAIMSVSGETATVSSLNSVTVAFTDPWTKQLATASFKQSSLGLKPKDAVTLTMQKTTPRKLTNVVKKTVPAANTTTTGKITKVTSTSSVTVSYTDPWTKKVATSVFTKAGHGLKLNDAVTFTISNTTPRKITNVVKKTVPVANTTIAGKITKVSSPSSVTVSYNDPLTKKAVTSVFTKAGHGLKLNDAVTLTIKTTIINIAKK
jgi:hypothetical protein